MWLSYALVKFLAYSAWCYLGLRLLAPAAARVPGALGYGGLRWLLGLGLGVLVFLLLGTRSPDSVATTYFALYTPLRVLEWGLMAVLMTPRHRGAADAPLRWLRLGWIVGGVGVSFLTDLVSPAGLAGKFCVGRCLC